MSYGTTAPTSSPGSGEGVSAVFNAAGSQSGFMNFAGALIAVFISAAILI
jgi:hypothetical protein